MLPLELKYDEALFNEGVLVLLLFIGLIFHCKTLLKNFCRGFLYLLII